MGIPVYQSKDYFDSRFPLTLRTHQGGEFQQQLHTHDYIQIAYVLSGVCNHRISDKSLKVCKGDLFIIPPGMAHSLNSIEHKPFELMLLDFLPFMVHQELETYTDSLRSILRFSEQGEEEDASPRQPWLHIEMGKQTLVEELLRDIREELDMREAGYEFSVRINLVKLLILIDRENRRMLQHSVRSSVEGEAGPVKEAIRFVQSNYSQDIRLWQGARAANMAPAYFCQRFKKETGRTFVEFLQMTRIQRARELISRGELPITDISFQVGFQNLSHFIRTFKKQTGLTPSQYKKSFGQE